MTILLRQLREELLPRERTQWHWSKHVKFRPSSIKTVPQRLCFCAHLSNCNLVTYWRNELSILGLLHLSISINLSNSFKFSCSIKFFHLVSSVYICLFPWESFSQHTVFISICGKAKKIGLVRNKDAVRYRLNSGCCMTILLPQLREELLPRERTQWHWSKHLKFRPSWIMTVPQRLSFFAQLSKCNLATFGLSTTTIPQSARLPAQQCHLLWKIGRLIRRRAKRPAFL